MGCYVGKKVDKTRPIIGDTSGKRNADFCQKVKDTIPNDYKNKSTVSDVWANYKKVFTENHLSCGKETGETAHIKRFNHTLQQYFTTKNGLLCGVICS